MTEIDEYQNEIIFHLDFIGKQLQRIADSLESFEPKEFPEGTKTFKRIMARRL